MKNSIMTKWSAAFFFSILILLSSCSLDDSTQAPDMSNDTATFLKPTISAPTDYIPGNTNARKNWMQGEGWAKGDDIPFVIESFGGVIETHSYNATLKAGVLSGTFEYINEDLEGELTAWVKGDVTCMVFEEDCKTVRMTGIITEASNEDVIGLYAVWIAENNGNDGLDATTDIRSGVSEATADFHCEIGLSKVAFDLVLVEESFFKTTEGNVKVKSMDCYGDVTGENGN